MKWKPSTVISNQAVGTLSKKIIQPVMPALQINKVQSASTVKYVITVTWSVKQSVWYYKMMWLCSPDIVIHKILNRTPSNIRLFLLWKDMQTSEIHMCTCIWSCWDQRSIIMCFGAGGGGGWGRGREIALAFLHDVTSYKVIFFLYPIQSTPNSQVKSSQVYCENNYA